MNFYFWFMRTFVDKPNKWYDGIKEPLRFILFIVTLMLTLLFTAYIQHLTMVVLALIIFWRLLYFRY